MVKTLLVAIATVLPYLCSLGVLLVRLLGGCISLGLLYTFSYIVPCVLISIVVLFLVLEYARCEVMAKERALTLSSQAPLLETPAMYDNI
jgi:hypothetical protein